MACNFRSWSTLKLQHSSWSKLVRLHCTDSHIAPTGSARNPAVQKDESGTPKIQTRIRNELSYHLPTVPLPPKLADSVKEVLKRERIIRVFNITDDLYNRLFQKGSAGCW